MPQPTKSAKPSVWVIPISAGLGVFLYQAFFHGFRRAFAVAPLTVLIALVVLSVYQRSKASQRPA
jgi:hypothetical protein